MKICILGAAGKSGRRLVREALARGHYVTASPPTDRFRVGAALRNEGRNNNTRNPI